MKNRSSLAATLRLQLWGLGGHVVAWLDQTLRQEAGPWGLRMTWD